MLTKLLAIILINPPIESDFLTMYQASKMLRVWDLSYTKLDYFINWGIPSRPCILSSFATENL